MKTKQQAIGYIIKACLDSELPAKQIRDVARSAAQMIPNAELLDNNDTEEYLLEIVEHLSLSDELTDELKRSLYWAHDTKREEQAWEIYNSFANIWHGITIQ